MTQQKGMTYEGSGVNYSILDDYKRRAQKAGLATAHYLKQYGFEELTWSRGESAYVMKSPWGPYFAFVIEGVGTKPLAAEGLKEECLKHGFPDLPSYFDHLAQCNVAMALNDLVTVGAMPLIYGQYAATGDSRWMDDKQRCNDLVDGTLESCHMSRCTWANGETPTLRRMVFPNTIDLAGATLGIIMEEKHLINPANIADGDVIILVGSSGIHANGLTMAHDIAQKLPQGYHTLLKDGHTYGESLLDPTFIYVPLIAACQKQGIDLHYTINITGHGWRKLMRANGNFRYVVERLPPQLPIFDFLQEHGPVDDREAYGNLNMGAGFALYVPDDEVKKTLEILAVAGYDAWETGHIEKSDAKQVVITPKNIVFDGSELGVR